MVLGQKVAIFDWEWGRKLAPREGQKIPCKYSCAQLFEATFKWMKIHFQHEVHMYAV